MLSMVENKELAAVKRVMMQSKDALKQDQLNDEDIRRILQVKEVGERPSWVEITNPVTWAQDPVG